ncbi:MAG: hypothetical protein ABWX76_05310 [Leifsonia flava]
MGEPTEPLEPGGTRLAPGVVLGGYRLVRRLGSDTGAPIWLAHADLHDLAVVLTICCEDEAARRRVESHTRVGSPHVLSLIDIATISDGRLLLASEQTDWSLATLLAARSRLAAGEAVTILAPITAGLAAIHAAGLVHGGLNAASVFFATDGRPVIGGFDGLRKDATTAIEADGSSSSTPGILADYRALSALIRAIGDVVDEPARTEITGVAEWLDTSIDATGADRSRASQLECRIFAVAPSLPVVLVADRRTQPVERDIREVRQGSSTLSAVPPLRVALSALARAQRLAVSLSGAAVRGRLGRVVRRRGLPIGLAVLVGALVVSAGLTAIPGAADGRQTPSTPSRSTAQTPATSAPAAEPTPGSPIAGLGFSTEEAQAVAGEDAAAAAAALLELRGRCAVHAEPSCVGLFAEAGSAIDDADRHAFGSRPAGGMLLVEPDSRERVELVQAYGDAVLTRAVPSNGERQPVLVLVVRTDTGWRLRDLFEPD